MSAVLVALGVFLLGLAVGRRPVPLEPFLATGPPPPEPAGARTVHLPGTAVAGGVAGVLTAAALGEQGPVALGSLGVAAGLVIGHVVAGRRRRRRAERLALELPIVADTLALHVIAGESISTALHRFVASGGGVAAEDIAAALDAEHQGLEAALRKTARRSAHPEAARLYDLLAYAHRTGGRLGDALASLAADYRSAQADAITAEGGRRSLAVYGPILALMVPVTLVFLMYPTLAGLSALSNP